MTTTHEETPEPMTAPRLREMRRRRGWTQARLARALGVTEHTIYRWEAGAGRIPPPMAKLLRLTLTP